MEYTGNYFVPNGDADDFGESVRFVHTKYPEYRIIIESRFPYRDAQGFARGVQNPDTALTVCFKGRMLETNSARVIEALRTQVKGYIGKKGPMEIQNLIAAGRQGGFFEVDKVEEAIDLRKEQLEKQARAQVLAELQKEREAEMQDEVSEVVVQPTPEEIEEIVYAQPVGPVTERPAIVGEAPVLECPNCGSLCKGKFCAECGYSLIPRAKRQWDCEGCGESFDSGFKLGNHKANCLALNRAIKPMVDSQPMTTGGGTENVGARKLQGLL